MPDTTPSPVSSPSSSARWRFFKLLAMWVPTVLAALAAGFFYWQWQQVQQGSSVAGSSTAVATDAQREEIETIVEELGKIVLLPTGEVPTLSTIKDKDALTENRGFFQEAENGDKVVVYQQAKKAFLYRPSTNKLINLAPINISETNTVQPSPKAMAGEAATDESSPSPEAESFTVELRNGTSQQGLTYDFESTLLKVFKQAEISDRNNAARNNYEESAVIAVNLAKKTQVQQVANELGLTVADMPAGEPKGETDMLIILGADQL